MMIRRGSGQYSGKRTFFVEWIIFSLYSRCGYSQLKSGFYQIKGIPSRDCRAVVEKLTFGNGGGGGGSELASN